MELLQHVADNPSGCDDPDCEICHVDVAIEEGVWDDASKAFWLAGYYTAVRDLTKALEEVRDEAIKAIIQPVLALKFMKTP